MNIKFISLLSLSFFTLLSCSNKNSDSILGSDKEKPTIDNEKKTITIKDKSNIITKSLENLSPYLFTDDGNTVISPSSYAVAMGGLLSVSSNVDSLKEKNGFSSSVKEETNSLLNSFNWSINEGKSSIFSALLHQQVGTKYAFDEEKAKSVESDHIKTMVSDRASAKNDAQEYLKEKMDFSLELPECDMDEGTITIGAVKMIDSFQDTQKEAKRSFYTVSGSIEVKAYPFYQSSFNYYKGTNYKACLIPVRETSNLVILPDEGVSLEDINLSKAYNNFMSKAERKNIIGYQPYFHTKSTLNLTNMIKKQIAGNEIYYSSLLKDDVVNDLQIEAVLQGTDYTFSPTGSKGESYTEIMSCGSAGPTSYEVFEVNRPFYALSIYDSFPMFVSKVTNPNQA